MGHVEEHPSADHGEGHADDPQDRRDRRPARAAGDLWRGDYGSRRSGMPGRVTGAAGRPVALAGTCGPVAAGMAAARPERAVCAWAVSGQEVGHGRFGGLAIRRVCRDRCVQEHHQQERQENHEPEENLVNQGWMAHRRSRVLPIGGKRSPE